MPRERRPNTKPPDFSRELVACPDCSALRRWQIPTCYCSSSAWGPVLADVEAVELPE